MEYLEKIVNEKKLSNLIVEYKKSGQTIRQSVSKYCQTCYEDGMMYTFKIVDGNNMNDIDSIIALIDAVAKESI